MFNPVARPVMPGAFGSLGGASPFQGAAGLPTAPMLQSQPPAPIAPAMATVNQGMPANPAASVAAPFSGRPVTSFRGPMSRV